MITNIIILSVIIIMYLHIHYTAICCIFLHNHIIILYCLLYDCDVLTWNCKTHITDIIIYTPIVDRLYKLKYLILSTAKI